MRDQAYRRARPLPIDGRSFLRLCVYCGSSTGHAAHFREAAAAFGTRLAEAQIELVFGGGHIGLMGILADAVLAAGGVAIGVIPQALVDRELAHGGLTELHIVGSMHERKARMAELSDGFVALPGGAGTLDELFEQWTWAQLGIHAKPCGFLNVAGYFDPLRTMVHKMVAEGFLRAEDAAITRFDEDAGALLGWIGEGARTGAWSIQGAPEP
jgi:uncharacterized protein (TIGR00730 family)